MEGIDVVVSVEALTLVLLFLIYMPVCLIVYWRLFPRLSLTSKRLVVVMLAAQLLVIILAVTGPTSTFERWLWDLSKEGNIPPVLASTQLAAVGGVALLTAWLARPRPVWQRLYLFAIGLVFLYIARDEFFILHETLPHWERYYAALGVCVAMVTLVAAFRSPPRMFIWHICLLIGLATSASGAIVLEHYRYNRICDLLGFVRLSNCTSPTRFEESLEMLGIWLVLVAVLGLFSDIVSTPSPRVRRALYSLPALWIILLAISYVSPRRDLWLLAQRTSVIFESGTHVYGYRLEKEESASRLWLHTVADPQYGYGVLGYSLHLVDQVSGVSIANRNEYANWHANHLLEPPGYQIVSRQWMEVELPPEACANRALWIVLGLWRGYSGDFTQQNVVASDHQLLSDTQVIMGELVLPAESADSASTSTAVFDNGFTLDSVDMPERARAGEILQIPFAWRTDKDGHEDYVQFLHFGHEDSGDWWVYDQQPLGPRLPTRLWYSDLADSEIWEVRLPADLMPGQYTVFTGLYRASDQERLPASDADGTPVVDARVPLGLLTVEGA